jgi:hypothetical protein
MMDSSQMPTETDEWKKSPGKKKRGTYTLEYRVKPRKGRNALFKEWEVWRTYHKRYRTPAQRDEAMIAMNRKDTLFEYRQPLGEAADE